MKNINKLEPSLANTLFTFNPLAVINDTTHRKTLITPTFFFDIYTDLIEELFKLFVNFGIIVIHTIRWTEDVSPRLNNTRTILGNFSSFYMMNK